MTLAIYFALGAVVMLSRFLFPRPRDDAAVTSAVPSAANEQRELAKAA